MPIDFQPLRSSAQEASIPAGSSAPVSNAIDFQPLQADKKPAEQSVVTQQGPSVADRVVQAASNVPGVQALANTAEPVTSRIVAAVGGAKQGVLDAAHDTGTLISNLLDMAAGKDSTIGKINRAVSDVGTKAYQSLSNAPVDVQAGGEHPALYGIGGGLGYVAGLGGMQAPIVNPLTRGVTGVLGKVAPSLAASPVVSGAISNGLVGAGMGAASDPNNPVRGAVVGGTLGAGIGAIGGVVGNKLKRSGDIIDFETDNLQKAGISPASDAGFSRLVKSLKDNGVDMEKASSQNIITDKMGDIIRKAGPLDNLDTAPAETITNLAQANYSKVVNEVNSLKKPLLESSQTFTAPSYAAAVSSEELPILSKKLQSALPKIPENATFDSLWSARQELDGVINSAKLKAASDVIYKRSLPGLVQSRAALTQDLQNAAESLGMGEQWAQLNKLYQTQVVPFSAFRTASGKMISEEDVMDGMRKVNTLLNPKLSPNFKELNKVAASLGPDGQDLVGQAMLQNIYKRSLNDKGFVEAKTLFTQLKKVGNSGLDTKVWGPKARQAAQGLLQIVDGADEALKTGQIQTPQAEGLYTKIYDSIIKSRAGVQLMRLLGSSKTPQTRARDIINKLITGLVVTGQTRPADEQQP